ncbi:MAG: hypothetical protein R3286_04750 [Gammaproteobacteria bacterium]|nr:hypothetical protein [Gammaproteobacteria bacterium]
MSPVLIYAACLAGAFVLWFVCNLIAGRWLRGIARATAIAVLCSPGIVVGHGIGVLPGLLALALQPSVFSLAPMLAVWLIAVAVILGVPRLRDHRGSLPPSADEVLLAAYPVKFFLFGFIASLAMYALIFADDQRSLAVLMLQYVMVFGGAGVNWWLCQRAARVKQAHALLTPIAFAVPAFIAASPVLPFVWYAGGAVGGLIGSGRRRTAAWIVPAVFAYLMVNSLLRSYYAATAAAHVVIQGGVIGNGLMAGLYACAGIVGWIALRREPRPRVQ